MKRYEVTLICHCVEISEDGTRQELMPVSGPSWNVPYKGMVAIQQILLKALTKIGSWGMARLTPEEVAEVEKMTA